ncbi:twin-arginine translocation signal domain-containing protein [Bacillus sp. Marseille-P3661]|nr:twin-arginine translocation signal domain-containing protein [Bacillus sp. Marseille-P3661]
MDRRKFLTYVGTGAVSLTIASSGLGHLQIVLVQNNRFTV